MAISLCNGVADSLTQPPMDMINSALAEEAKASEVPPSASNSTGSKKRQIGVNKAIAQIPSYWAPEKIGNYAIEIKLNDSHFTDQASDEIITFSQVGSFKTENTD